MKRKITSYRKNYLLYIIIYFILLILLLILSITSLVFHNYIFKGKLFNLIYLPLFILLISIVFIVLFFKKNGKSKLKAYIDDVVRVSKLSQYLYIEGVFEKQKNIFVRPYIIYKRYNYFIEIKIKNNLVKHKDLFLKIDEFCSTAFNCELIKKEIKAKYFTFTFLLNDCDVRLDIKYSNISKKSIDILKDVSWNFSKYPHALICGSTGTGKTYLLQFFIYQFYKLGAEVYISDPKKTDLSYLGYKKEFKNNVACEIDDIINMTKFFYEKMLERTEEFDKLCNGEAGFNYYDFNLKPYFLVLDELSAFVSSLEYKEEKEFFKALTQIILKGRQLGFFVIVGLQRPDAQYFPDGLRDQFSLRIALGLMSPGGYSMIFGDSTRIYSSSDVVGFGYYVLNSLLIKEFYSPYISESFIFTNEMIKLYNERLSLNQIDN